MPAIAMDQSTVVILNEAGVRARYFPAPSFTKSLYSELLSVLLFRPQYLPRSCFTIQLKKEAREEKLAAVTVCLRGDRQAVNAFVGPARDLGHDSVLARIYPMLSVAQHACPWARLECLSLFLQFLQFLFSPSYLVLKGQFDCAALAAYSQVGFRGPD